MVQTLITDYYNRIGDKVYHQSIKIEPTQTNNNTTNKIIRGYNKKTGSWHCTECGIDMGANNPRQLCRKIYCGGN